MIDTATAADLGLTEEDLQALRDAAEEWRDLHDMFAEQAADDVMGFITGDPAGWVASKVDRERERSRGSRP